MIDLAAILPAALLAALEWRRGAAVRQDTR